MHDFKYCLSQFFPYNLAVSDIIACIACASLKSFVPQCLLFIFRHFCHILACIGLCFNNGGMYRKFYKIDKVFLSYFGFFSKNVVTCRCVMDRCQ